MKRKDIAKRVASRYERLKARQKVLMYHATSVEDAAKMINGFDSLRDRKRHFTRARHKGLFVSPFPLDQFGSVVLELELYAKFLHGTDWGGNIGRKVHSPEHRQYLEKKYPESFRPSLTDSLHSTHEPQALYLGLIKPSQIKRVRYHGQWMSRSEFLESQAQEPRAKRMGLVEKNFDMSSPSHSLNDVYEVVSRVSGRSVDKVKASFRRFKDSGDMIYRTLKRIGFGDLAAEAYSRRIRDDL